MIEKIFTLANSCHFQAVLDGSGGNRPGQVGTISHLKDAFSSAREEILY